MTNNGVKNVPSSVRSFSSIPSPFFYLNPQIVDHPCSRHKNSKESVWDGCCINRWYSSSHTCKVAQNPPSLHSPKRLVRSSIKQLISCTRIFSSSATVKKMDPSTFPGLSRSSFIRIPNTANLTLRGWKKLRGSWKNWLGFDSSMCFLSLFFFFLCLSCLHMNLSSGQPGNCN